MRAVGEGAVYKGLKSLLNRFLRGYISVDIEDDHYIPSRGGAILCGNHPTVLDGPLLGIVSPRPVRFLVAADMISGFWMERFMDWVGALRVDRSGPGKNSEVLAKAVEALRQGEVVGIFPEGKTDRGTSLLPFKVGVALLARKTGVPVVPFALDGTQDLLVWGGKWIRPGRVRLRFGEPLVFERWGDKEIPGEVVEETLERIYGRVERLWCGLRERDENKRPELVWDGVEVGVSS